jgi:TIR domain
MSARGAVVPALTQPTSSTPVFLPPRRWPSVYAIVTGVGTGPVTERSAEHRDFFISRAGENAAVAIQIAEILRGAGYSTFIQDRDFGNADFMARMADGFAMVDRGARVIALLSHHYQKKPHCMKEAHYPLTDDPSNKRGAAYCPARQRLHAGRAPQGHPVPRGETTVTATGLTVGCVGG